MQTPYLSCGSPRSGLSDLKISLDDRTPSFEAFWEEADGLAPEARHRLWTDRYEGRNRDLFDLYYSDWAHPGAVPRALSRFPDDAGVIAGRARRLRSLLPRIAEEATVAFGRLDSDLRFVAFVGVYASNAWVTSFQGRPVAFFAVEQLPDAPYDSILVAHETAHEVHRLTRTGAWPEVRIDLRLFEEGVAIVASEAVLPGFGDGAYLWFADGFDDWAESCTSAWPATRATLLTAGPTSKSARDRLFVVGGGGKQGLPERAGYPAARYVVTALLNKHTLAEMIGWSADRAGTEVRAVLESTS